MAANTPEDLDRLFAVALNAGDIEGLMRLYEPGAAMRPGPGQVVQGLAAIRASLAGFIAMKPTLTITSKVLGQCNEIALMTGTWTLTRNRSGREPREHGRPERRGRASPGRRHVAVHRRHALGAGMEHLSNLLQRAGSARRARMPTPMD